MKNIFRNLFRKKKEFKPYIPTPMYGPQPTIYGPPEVFHSRTSTAYEPRGIIYGPPEAFIRRLSGPYYEPSDYTFTPSRIPGKLTVLTGPDKGKSFSLIGTKISRVKLASQILLSVGRSMHLKNNPPPAAPAQINHIEINDPSRTMSKIQFDISYDLSNTYLRCLSLENRTIVDGKTLIRYQIQKLKDGSIITAGYVELRYDI